MNVTVQKRFWLGMLVMALIFGIALAGCDNGTTSGGGPGPIPGPTPYSDFDGTWSYGPATLEISGSNFIYYVLGTTNAKGTLSFTASTFTFNTTHVWQSGSWVPSVITTTGNYVRNSATSFTISGITGQFSVLNGTWSKSGSINNTIDTSFRGKLEMKSFINDSGSYTIPCTYEGVSLTSAGYEIGETYVKVFNNGILMATVDNLHTEGNSLIGYGIVTIGTMQLSGNNLTITYNSTYFSDGIENFVKVSKFSWE